MKGMMTVVTCQVLGRFLKSDIFIFCLHHQLLQHNVKTDLNPHKQNHIIKYIFHFQNIQSISIWLVSIQLVSNAEIARVSDASRKVCM